MPEGVSPIVTRISNVRRAQESKGWGQACSSRGSGAFEVSLRYYSQAWLVELQWMESLSLSPSIPCLSRSRSSCHGGFLTPLQGSTTHALLQGNATVYALQIQGAASSALDKIASQKPDD
jgi:hypothetical protein